MNRRILWIDVFHILYVLCEIQCYLLSFVTDDDSKILSTYIRLVGCEMHVFFILSEQCVRSDHDHTVS